MKFEDIDWTDINKYLSVLDLPEEVWKNSPRVTESIGGVAHSVSNYGRCRHEGKTHPQSGKFVKPRVFKITDNGAGYKKVALSFKGATKNFYVHRIVAEVFLDNPDNKPQVNHMPSGLGKFDNRVEHLEWCTEKHNIKDAHKNGQMKNRSKLTTTTKHSDIFIAEMYRMYKDTGKVGATAKEYGVSRTTLSSIVNKRSRTNVTDLIDKEYE